MKDWCGQGCHLLKKDETCALCSECPGWIDADGAACRCPNGCADSLQEWIDILNKLKDNRMNTFPIKPLGDRVIVKVFDAEETTPSGLVLPKTSNKFRTAKVMAVGRGLFSDGAPIPPEVAVGDIVQLPAHTGDEIAVGAEKYTMVTERVIVAVVGHETDECCMKKAAGKAKTMLCEDTSKSCQA